MSIFSCACWPSVSFLWRNVCLGLLSIFLIGLFVFLLLNCLYILEVKLLSVALFADIFSANMVGCLFVLFMISFAVQKLVSFTRSHLFIFGFIYIAVGGQFDSCSFAYELPFLWKRLLSFFVFVAWNFPKRFGCGSLFIWPLSGPY